MKSRTIDKSDSDSLILRDETHFYDQKAIEVSGAKVQKIAVAFANSDGGEFIIGIKDSKEEKDPAKRWAGAEKVEDFNSHLQALSEVSPTIDFSCTFLTSQVYKELHY
jgi:ATP-dependent DNA helicase RecG